MRAREQTESEAVMQEDRQELDYPYPQFTTIRPSYLHLVDSVLQRALGRIEKRTEELLPVNQRNVQTWSYPAEELRRSRLGQALLTIADYVSDGQVPREKVKHAMERVKQILFGNLLSDDYTIPDQFDTTDLGKLFHAAVARMYRPEDLLAPVQAYRALGITRQSLYDRLHKGKLTPIYWHGDLRFLRSEIEAWKAQREQRTSPTHQEE